MDNKIEENTLLGGLEPFLKKGFQGLYGRIKMEKQIALIRGDGIGPEIVEEAVRCLDAVAQRFGHAFSYSELLMGGAALDETGLPLPEETLQGCLSADGVLLGAIGGPKWENRPGNLRPEAGLLALRKGMGVFANLRPARLMPALKDACPLREAVADKGFDFMMVRELIGGIYFGRHETLTLEGLRVATDEMRYDEKEIRRILHTAFQAARGRGKKLCSVDKANVLDTSRLWRAVAEEMAKEYPDVELSHMLVDNAAMQIVRDPSAFDVIVTENMFGDILSDEASVITGSIGLIPSASLGEDGRGLYEPIHGSAPDIAGQGKANPIGTILSAALMLRHSLGLAEEAACVERAVDAALAKGLRTPDIAAGGPAVNCETMGRKIAEEIAIV